MATILEGVLGLELVSPEKCTDDQLLSLIAAKPNIKWKDNDENDEPDEQENAHEDAPMDAVDGPEMNTADDMDVDDVEPDGDAMTQLNAE
jgi:hypothetical protein